MPSIQIRNTQDAINTKEMNRAYNEKARERKEVGENVLSYKEELKKAREDEQKATAQKRALEKRRPVDGQGSIVAKKSAQQMLDLLTELAGTPNMPMNIVGNTNE